MTARRSRCLSPPRASITSRMGVSMGPGRKTPVMPSRSSVSTTLTGSNVESSRMTLRAPRSRYGYSVCAPETRARAGAGSRPPGPLEESPARRCPGDAGCGCWCGQPRWVVIHTLGKPVVPVVGCTQQGESSSTSTCGSSGLPRAITCSRGVAQEGGLAPTATKCLTVSSWERWLSTTEVKAVSNTSATGLTLRAVSTCTAMSKWLCRVSRRRLKRSKASQRWRPPPRRLWDSTATRSPRATPSARKPEPTRLAA